MAKYCDSDILERNWFEWIVAESTPLLDGYRERGALWTKIVGIVRDENGRPIKKHKKVLADPSYHIRTHFINSGSGIFAISNCGKIITAYTVDLVIKAPNGRIFYAGVDIPTPEECSDNINTIGKAKSAGYYQENSTKISWDAMVEDIYKICGGIATKFNVTEDDRDELIHESALQVIKKLTTHKLVYTPGRAPVFNLLTTTIHRCIFSALSRDKRRVNNLRRFTEDWQAQHANQFGPGSIIEV